MAMGSDSNKGASFHRVSVRVTCLHARVPPIAGKCFGTQACPQEKHSAKRAKKTKVPFSQYLQSSENFHRMNKFHGAPGIS